MISAQPDSTPRDTSGRHTVRLEMKPVGAARGYVDGGWWPRSTEPTTEFSELCPALEPWVGVASRVSYNLGTWGVAARKVTVDGHVVRLEGFATTDPDTVVVIGSDSRRVSLLVVPPDTTGDMGRAQLRSAAASDSVASAEAIRQGSQRE